MLLLIRHLKLWHEVAGEGVKLTNLGEQLFDKFGNNKDFLQVVSLSLASIGGSGSLRPQYEERASLF